MEGYFRQHKGQQNCVPLQFAASTIKKKQIASEYFKTQVSKEQTFPALKKKPNRRDHQHTNSRRTSLDNKRVQKKAEKGEKSEHISIVYLRKNPQWILRKSAITPKNREILSAIRELNWNYFVQWITLHRMWSGEDSRMSYARRACLKMEAKLQRRVEILGFDDADGVLLPAAAVVSEKRVDGRHIARRGL